MDSVDGRQSRVVENAADRDVQEFERSTPLSGEGGQRLHVTPSGPAVAQCHHFEISGDLLKDKRCNEDRTGPSLMAYLDARAGR